MSSVDSGTDEDDDEDEDTPKKKTKKRTTKDSAPSASSAKDKKTKSKGKKGKKDLSLSVFENLLDFLCTFFSWLHLFSEDKEIDGKEKKSKSKEKEKDKKKEPASMFQINGGKDTKIKKKGDLHQFQLILVERFSLLDTFTVKG